MKGLHGSYFELLGGQRVAQVAPTGLYHVDASGDIGDVTWFKSIEKVTSPTALHLLCELASYPC